MTWSRQTITEIHRQSPETCDCTRMFPDGTTRRLAINSTNALIVVTAGPTLTAANIAGNLPRTLTGQPIYRVENANV